MVDELIVIHKNKSRVSTFLIAKGFERKHEHVLRLVKRYQKDFEIIGSLPVAVEKRGRGQLSNEFLLNEAQFIFLAALFKNSKIVVEFKRKLAVQFVKINQLLAQVKSQHSDQSWLMSRDLGKESRIALTDKIKSFAEYAKEQGSKNATRYYTNITKMTNNLLFVFDGKYTGTRNFLTGHQLMALASAEQIISKGLTDGMKAKMFYKDIYKEVKSRVTSFVKLHGQSEVIEKQLMIKD